MKISNSIKVFGLGVLAAGLLSTSLAAVSAKRVGPVSQYGQLQAGKNSAGKGQIYGACKGVSDGNEVAVQGMSLFWSIAGAAGATYWTSDYVDAFVSKQKIQLIRAPMGIDEDWGDGNYFSNTPYYQGLMNAVVQSAIENDIYVLIDYHSHCAEANTDKALQFFSYMAQTWGSYDNVIFEIYNEPKKDGNCNYDGYYDAAEAKTYWKNGIAPYARKVISEIRKHSDNLIVVGTPYYDQYVDAMLVDPLEDDNVAYSFHYYAGEDQYRHTISSQGRNAENAMAGGYSVFVTEWGNSAPSGNGGFNSSYSTEWYNWMKTNKLSGANWSVSNKEETASYFTTAGAWNYSESGKWVNANVFASLPATYTECSTNPASSSSTVASSSSVQPEGTTAYIDDLEDGDSVAYTGGIWYAYTDDSDKGASTISNATNDEGYRVVLSASTAGDTSKYVAGMTGIKLSQGDNPYDPYVALGVKLNPDESAYDLSNCTSISYRYKGASHNFKAEDIAVEDYAFHQTSKLGSSSWKEASFSWGALLQPTWSETEVTLSKKRINKFTWEVKEEADYDYLYIDDVRCDGMAIVPVKPSSSSSSAKSSSSVASSSSAKSSSSIASSSSAKSSSSVASSSSARSSSSVASSSSVRSSSSAKSSSSAATQVVVVGDLEQTVAQGGQFETVTFKNVQTFNRNTWNLHFFNIEQSGSEVTVAGSVPNYVQVGDHTETLTINNTQFEIKLTVTAAASSSSASVENSSSSSVEESSSSETTTVVNAVAVNPLKVSMAGRMLQVAGAEKASVDVFDMQGSPVASFKQVAGSVSLESLRQGNYIVRVRSGSMNLTRRIAIK